MNLNEWLNKIQSIHVIGMDLSLERVAEVAKRLNITKPTCPVITIAGTNGKGSCVAGLEAIYRTAGYKVGTFTSPILFRHNEYIRIDGKELSDTTFCEAFVQIERLRGDITLTPFEFNALAAFYIFTHSPLDVWLLEVGLGGRYDATNVIDADIAIVTSIGIDHVEWLGDTREKIAYEKAGIFRNNKPAICGDIDPPQTLMDYAQQIQARLFCQQQQFGFTKQASNWSWWSEKNKFEHLPLTKLALQNMSTVLMAVELLQDKLPVTLLTLETALATVDLTGRIQVFPGKISNILDVSHNPASAKFLANWLAENPCSGKTRAVFSMLGDKDIAGTIEVIQDFIDEWYVFTLATKRAATKAQLLDSFQQKVKKNFYDSACEAYKAAHQASREFDRVIVFGSFHTVAELAENVMGSLP